MISIITPTFNRKTYLIELVESCLYQTVADWELIIVDDGSNDGTHLELLKVQDPRIKYYRRPKEMPKGANACRNFGMAQAAGEWVMFLDSDDLLGENAIEQRIFYIKNNSNLDFQVFQVAKFNNNSKKVLALICDLKSDDNDLDRMIKRQSWAICNTVIKKRIAAELQFDEAVHSWQDIDFHIRLLLKTDKYIKHNTWPSVFVRMGYTDSNRITAGFFSLEKIINRLKLLNKFFLILPSRYTDVLLVYVYYLISVSNINNSYSSFRNVIIYTLTIRNIESSLTHRILLKSLAFLKGFRLTFFIKVIIKIFLLLYDREVLKPRKKQVKFKYEYSIK